MTSDVKKLVEALRAWQQWWELPAEQKRPDVAARLHRRGAAALESLSRAGEQEPVAATDGWLYAGTDFANWIGAARIDARLVPGNDDHYDLVLCEAGGDICIGRVDANAWRLASVHIDASKAPISPDDIRRQALEALQKARAYLFAGIGFGQISVPPISEDHPAFETFQAVDNAIRSLAASPPVPDPRDAEIEDERKFLNWLLDTIGEININNYHHDDVCRMNETNVEAILAIGARIAALRTGKGGTHD